MATVLSPAETRYQEDRISDNAVPNIIAANAACLSLACIAVALRFICRKSSQMKLEADDWLILAALVCLHMQFLFSRPLLDLLSLLGFNDRLRVM